MPAPDATLFTPGCILSAPSFLRKIQLGNTLYPPTGLPAPTYIHRDHTHDIVSAPPHYTENSCSFSLLTSSLTPCLCSHLQVVAIRLLPHPILMDPDCKNQRPHTLADAQWRRAPASIATQRLPCPKMQTNLVSSNPCPSILLKTWCPTLTRKHASISRTRRSP
ncbi:hypothetical protein C8J57DRAFT_1310018 [Mycena rebaudengoi]|nr:hypothetical protein C8J57DRAFT_1310018 [Mycena rebaudengoi]